MHTARYRRFFIFALLLLSFLLKGLTAQAAVTLLEKGEQKIPLHNNFQLFEDTTASLIFRIFCRRRSRANSNHCQKI
jgi:hypothetical protein